MGADGPAPGIHLRRSRHVHRADLHPVRRARGHHRARDPVPARHRPHRPARRVNTGRGGYPAKVIATGSPPTLMKRPAVLVAVLIGTTPPPTITGNLCLRTMWVRVMQAPT